MTIELTGTEDRIDSFVDLLRPFGIKELARTGQVAMLRGSNGK
jgi:acetolactate synthase-1/3 small subunit